MAVRSAILATAWLLVISRHDYRTAAHSQYYSAHITQDGRQLTNTQEHKPYYSLPNALQKNSKTDKRTWSHDISE